jgi:hypothetical protein
MDVMVSAIVDFIAAGRTRFGDSEIYRGCYVDEPDAPAALSVRQVDRPDALAGAAVGV